MGKYGVIPPELVEIRSEKTGFVADVRGGEPMVDAHVTMAANKKASEKAWDAGKLPFRDLAGQVRVFADKQGKPITRTNFLGFNNNVIEVEYSSTRKNLSGDLLEAAKVLNLPDLIVEEREVILRGELVAWVLDALAAHVGKDPRMVVKTKVVLSPKFEEIAQKIRAAGQPNPLALIEQLSEAGLNASAVEAKVKGGQD